MMMIELLKKWAALEPDRCIKVIRLVGATMYDIGSAVLSVADNGKRRVYINNHLVESEQVFIDVLQGAVQNALDARRLNYNIRRRHPGGSVRADGFAVDIFLEGCWLMNDVYYATLAEALLSAYVKALEANDANHH